MRRKSSPSRRSVDVSLKGPLNPKESRDRINEMIKYIEQVIDKRLAQLVIEEESAVEKCRAEVLEGPMKEIEESFSKREYLTNKETNHHYLNTMKAAKITILKNIDNCINNIKNDVKHRIYCRLEVDFETLMKPLLLQGLLLMLEKDVSLRVRYSDAPKVRAFFDYAVHFYYKKTHDDLKIKLDEVSLQESERGRMVLYNRSKTVIIDLDLQEKVDRIGNRVIPILFKSVFADKVLLPQVKQPNVETDSKLSPVILDLPPNNKSSLSLSKAKTTTEMGKLEKKISFGRGISSTQTLLSSVELTEHSGQPKAPRKSRKKNFKQFREKNLEFVNNDVESTNIVGKKSGDDNNLRQEVKSEKKTSNLPFVHVEPKNVVAPANFGRIDFPVSPAPPKKRSFINERDDLETFISGENLLNPDQADGDSLRNNQRK